jgi:hypothetical protein
MSVRIFIGAGLFALGYLLGKEIGRTESIRGRLRLASEGKGEGMPTELKSGRQSGLEVSSERHPAAG